MEFSNKLHLNVFQNFFWGIILNYSEASIKVKFIWDALKIYLDYS